MTHDRSITPFCSRVRVQTLHVNAAVAHYQISLACLCNVGGSNVSEWEPGSESTSEPRLGHGCCFIRSSVFVLVCPRYTHDDIMAGRGGVCSSLCGVLIRCQEVNAPSSDGSGCVLDRGHYAKRCIKGALVPERSWDSGGGPSVCVCASMSAEYGIINLLRMMSRSKE